MKEEEIERAMMTAKVFINRAEATLADMRRFKKEGWYYAGTKNSGSLRRMSMELTRFLASMRNNK